MERADKYLYVLRTYRDKTAALPNQGDGLKTASSVSHIFGYMATGHHVT